MYIAYSQRVIGIFLFGADEDKELRALLRKHLKPLALKKLIEIWDDDDVKAGSDRKSAIDTFLRNVDILLFLISPDCIDLDSYASIEGRALEKHDAGELMVVPVLLRPLLWHYLSIGRLKGLPDSEKPVTDWRNRDDAFVNIVRGIVNLITFLHNEKPVSPLNMVPARSGELLKYWYMPYDFNAFFTAREEMLEDLHREFCMSESTNPLRQIITGPGGIGKTQIVVEYANRYRREYQTVFWIKADTVKDIVASFVHLADLLNLPARNGKEQDIVVAAVKRWLQRHTPWLLILDNVEDVAQLDEFIPMQGKGDVLVTTRAQEIDLAHRMLVVEKMQPGEGMLLLLRRAKGVQGVALESVSAADIAVVGKIVQCLDGLPLALDQAGAYLEETKSSLASYLTTYRAQRSQLLKRRGKGAVDHPESVMATFTLCFKKVKRLNRAAAELLQFCAFLDPDSIPEEILQIGASDLGSVLQPVVADTFTLDTALNDLAHFSLVRRHTETHSVSMHRLVQDVLQERMDKTVQRVWAERVVRVVNRIFPEAEFEHWSVCQQYLAHALVCADLVRRWNIELPEAARLLNRAGNYLYARARHAEAQSLYEQALAIRRRVLGAEHSETAQTLNDLGDVLHSRDKYDLSRRYYEEALAIRQRVLGLGHKDTAQTLNDLGELAQTLEDYAQAEEYYQSALAIRQRVLEEADLGIAESLSNLAGCYEEQEKYEQAEEYYKHALEIREGALGPEHIGRAKIYANLARFCRVRGKYEEAEEYYQKALAVNEYVFGQEHPDVAAVLNNFAVLYRGRGQYIQAERLLKSAVEIWEQMLGLEHTNLGYGLKNLGMVYHLQENYEQAEPLYWRALTILVPRFGAQISTVREIQKSYTALLMEMGREEEARQLPEEIRALDKRYHKGSSE